MIETSFHKPLMKLEDVEEKIKAHNKSIHEE